MRASTEGEGGKGGMVMHAFICLPFHHPFSLDIYAILTNLECLVDWNSKEMGPKMRRTRLQLLQQRAALAF